VMLHCSKCRDYLHRWNSSHFGISSEAKSKDPLVWKKLAEDYRRRGDAILCDICFKKSKKEA